MQKSRTYTKGGYSQINKIQVSAMDWIQKALEGRLIKIVWEGNPARKRPLG